MHSMEELLKIVISLCSKLRHKAAPELAELTSSSSPCCV